MAMTGGMALTRADHFFEDKESSAYGGKLDQGSTDLFDEFLNLGGDDSSEPDAQEQKGYYEQLGFAPPDAIMMSPPTSVDTSQLASVASSTDDRDHLHTGAIASLQSRRAATGSSRATQLTLQEQSRLAAGVGKGSISDSELQRLEGLSMQSPHRANGPQQPSTSGPSSPRTQTAAAESPKKPGRMEMLYASIRKTMRVRTERPPPTMSSAPIGSNSTGEIVRRGKFMHHPSWDLPSPPLSGHTGLDGPSQHDPLGTSFVNGYVDDPFGRSPFHGGQGQGQQTVHSGYTGLIAPIPAGANHVHGWLHADGYISSSATSADEMAWSNGNNNNQHHNPPSTPSPWWPTTPGNPMTNSAPRGSANGVHSANAKNATLNLALHLQQGAPVYQNGNNHHHHYVAGPNGVNSTGHQHHRSTGAIPTHMPQPRHPAPAPILHQRAPAPAPAHGHSHSLSLDSQARSQSQSQSYLAPPTRPRPPRAAANQQQHQPTHHPDLQPTTPLRRPKPRAPSSGARLHTGGPLPQTSPRKGHQRTRSASSTSTTTFPSKPSSRPARRATSQQDLHSSSRCEPATTTGVVNSSIRKRRSRSSIAGAAPRTPSNGSSSCAAAESSSPTKGGGIGFVNYTPDDRQALMTGVAPSGTSKTKARREREAAEQRRRLSEAVMKAVADGDLERLRSQGIVLEGSEGGMVY